MEASERGIALLRPRSPRVQSPIPDVSISSAEDGYRGAPRPRHPGRGNPLRTATRNLPRRPRTSGRDGVVGRRLRVEAPFVSRVGG